MGLARARAGFEPSKVTVAQTRPVAKRMSLRERFANGTVGDSEDLKRVLALRRREKPSPEQMQAIVNEMTFKLKTPRGQQTLRDHQAWVLWEAPQVRGAIAPIRTGGGKTLIGMLAPMVFPPVSDKPLRALLFLPPSMRAQFKHDWGFYGQHWRLPNLAKSTGIEGSGKLFDSSLPTLHVVAYSELSHAKSTALLMQIKPDLILGDEISSLGNMASSRAFRFLNFISLFPDTRFCGWDASIIGDSLADFWHLLAIALDEGSPLPLDEAEFRKWTQALDPESEDGYFLPGALMKLCEPGESARSGFRRRLIETPGVIATEENALGIPLIFQERKPPPVPDVIKMSLKNLRRAPADGGWKRPDGEEFTEMTEVVACARQLASGLFMRWRFPKGEPEKTIDEWFLRRQNWNRELRTQLSSPKVHMDSPKLCKNAAERWFDGGCTGCSRGPREEHETMCREVESHPLWPSYTFLEWRAVENTVYHETETVWMSDWLLQDAAAWAREAPGIVWVDHPAFGHELEKLTGFRYYGGGEKAAEEIVSIDGSVSIICSVEANKRGKNLQALSRNLIVSFPSSNETVEQLVGRTARSGQNAPEVRVSYYAHTEELENSLEKAKSRAKFVKETLGSDQKMMWGTWVGA